MLHNKVIAASFLCLVLALGTNILIQAGAVESRVADAAMNGDLAAVRNLLKQGADVNAGNSGGVTALMIAAANSRAEMVELLVHAGANVQARTERGETALSIARTKGDEKVIRLLDEASGHPGA